jgi:hypothetical protein
MPKGGQMESKIPNGIYCGKCGYLKEDCVIMVCTKYPISGCALELEKGNKAIKCPRCIKRSKKDNK